jgi:hypothetical protein
VEFHSFTIQLVCQKFVSARSRMRRVIFLCGCGAIFPETYLFVLFSFDSHSKPKMGKATVSKMGISELPKRAYVKMEFSNIHEIKRVVIHYKNSLYKINDCFDFKGCDKQKLRAKFRAIVSRHKQEPEAFAKYDDLIRNGMPDYMNVGGNPSDLGFYIDWKVFELIKGNLFNGQIVEVSNDLIKMVINFVLTNLTGEHLKDAVNRKLIDNNLNCLNAFTPTWCQRFLDRHKIVGRTWIDSNRPDIRTHATPTLAGDIVGNAITNSYYANKLADLKRYLYC